MQLSAGPLGIDRKASSVLFSMMIAVSLAAGMVSAPGTAEEAGRFVRVIVQGTGSIADTTNTVESLGGRVTRSLPIVDGVAAEVSAPSLNELTDADGIRHVTRDVAVGFQGLCLLNCESDEGGGSTDDGSTGSTSFDPYEGSAYTGEIVRSKPLWDKGITGKGMNVALIDTGVYAGHPDLAGRVVHCEDLSHEAGTAAHCADTFGHGTFMAGLIAGNGASSSGRYKGAAPEANIVSVKLAGFDGATDVSHVLAGIQWTVAHKDKYAIRAMNLSLGTDSAQSYNLSPLNFAVQKAWKAGIVVVVSGGNTGPDYKTVTKPADDPYVITVGSANSEGTTDIGDDRVPGYSSRGPTRADGVPKPDVVAPGVHTISLRSPGSAIDQKFCTTACVGDNYFRGTGTSMSAATTTGIIAQVLQNKPSLDPDQVKYRIVNTARKIATTDKYVAGKGIVDAYASATSTTTKRANQGLLLGLGTGLGTIQSDRGSFGIEVYTPAGEAGLSGELKAQYRASLVSLSNPLGLVPWSGLTYTTTGWDPLTWATTSWVDADWAASKWKASKWKETVWDASKWKGTEWDNADWDASKWKDADWDASKWKATTWQSAWYATAWD